MPRGRRLRAPRSLRALTWIFVAAMIAATLGTGVAIYTAQRRAIVQLVDQRIATAVDAIAHEGERPMPTPVLVERLRMLASDRDTGDIGAMLVDAQGCTLGVMKGPAAWSSPDGLALIRAALGRTS